MRGMRGVVIAIVLGGLLPQGAWAQGTVIPQPVAAFYDANGDPLNGGKLYTYACGGTTNQATYSDEAVSVANANPVVLNSAGRAVVFLKPLCYRFDLKTSADALVWSQDQIQQNGPWNITKFTGKVQYTAPPTLTVASNAIVPTDNVHKVDTAGGAATLKTITTTNVTTGFILTLTGNNPGANPVTVENGTGNMSLANGVDFAMNTATAWIQLVLSGTTWYEISRSIQSTFNTNDAVTNVVTDIVTMNHASTGVVANGFATGLRFTGESSTTDLRQMARIQSRWTDVTDATRTSALDFQTVNSAGALTTQMTISGPGVLTVNGFGTHDFPGAGTGTNVLRLQNTTAGTGNAVDLRFGNDNNTTLLQLSGYSSTFTPSGIALASGIAFNATGAGGLSLSASVGDIRFYAGGGTEVGRIDGPQWFLNDTSNVNNVSGLTINQVAADDEVLTLKSSDVAHGITGATETDTFGVFAKESATDGGLRIDGFPDTGGRGLQLRGVAITENAARSTAANAAVLVTGLLKSGTGLAAASANVNLVAVSDGNSTRFILDSDGDSHQDVGTAWTNFDAVDDLLMLNSLAAEVSREDDPWKAIIQKQFASGLDGLMPRATMQAMKLVTFNADGHHFVNMSKLAMVHTGAIRQLGLRLAQQDEVVRRLVEQNAQLELRLAALAHDERRAGR